MTGSNFTDIKTAKEHTIDFQDKSNGCYVTRAKGFLLALLAIAACVVVGVAVYYAHPDRGHGNSHEEDSAEGTDAPLTTDTSTIDMDVRLPADLVATHYDLKLRPDIYASDPEDFSFTGVVDIHLNVARRTNTIQLHIKSLDINYSSLSVTLGSGAELVVDCSGITEIPAPYEFLMIPLKSSVGPGQSIIVHIEYSGPLRKDLAGIYYSDYVNDEGQTVYLLTSQLQATDARKVFPCLDEPALKATFDVTLERRASHTSKSNMHITRTDALSDGWLADVYERTPIMSTYLLAFLISDFQCTSRNTSNDILVEVCARPPAFSQTEFANFIAVEMQEWFEWYHNVSYPLSKMTHVALPDFSAGAMENWGLLMYRETALLYDPMTSSAANKQRVAVVVSHELAHMWFGDLVTPEWWDDIWLNEGFASHMELQGIHHVHDFDQWRMEEQFLVEDLQYVMVEDSLATSHPIYQQVNHPDEISEIFDSITYSKGSSVIRMMKYFVGQETFRWGLSHYLKDRQYTAAHHSDLFQFLTEQAETDGKSIDVSGIMGTWIRQMGYPVVMVTRDGNSLTLTQKHFILDPTENVTRESEYDYVWHVPITYITDKSSYTTTDDIPIHWLTESQGSITNVESSDWVLANVDQRFYYRVNYERSNWVALITQIRRDHGVIPRANRAQIIDDLFNLGRAGEVDQTLAMSATQYMQDEQEYTVWYALNANMGYLTRMLSKGEGKQLLDEYMQSLLRGQVEQLGYEDRSDDGHLTLRKRAMLLGVACRYQLPECLNASYWAFQDWVNNTAPTSVNFASTIRCYGIAEGGVEEWDQAYQRFLTSNSGAEKDSILSALSCSRHAWILQRYLQWAMAEDEYGIAQQDMRRVLITVARNPAATHAAWAFFKANWHVFYERFGESSFVFSSMVDGLTSSFSTEWELADLQAFMELHPEQGTATRQFQKSVEGVKANIRWRQRNEAGVIRWLKMQTGRV